MSETLESAGWYPGRRVDAQVEAWSALFSQRGVAMFEAARVALLEFGGLKSYIQGSRAGLSAPKTSFDIDPELMLGDETLLPFAASRLGHKCYPLGELDAGVSLLLIDDRGWVFLWHDDTYFVAKSLYEALVSFILGLRMD